MKTNIKFLSIFAMAMLIFSCKKEDSKKQIDTRPKDIDGNLYDTVVIGTQTWTVQNLKTTHYNDGTPITTNLSDAQWASASGGSYAVVSGTYGNLYNWYAVNTGKLAPKGWRIPTENEWNILITYLGGKIVAGGAMKDTALWLAPNTGATNSSGFKALPSGARNNDGSFYSIGSYGYFWSSTAYGVGGASFYFLKYFNSEVIGGNANIRKGYSVRCIRD